MTALASPSVLRRAGGLFIVWLVLTQSFDPFYLGLGLVSALAIARLHTVAGVRSGMRWAALPIYLPWLLWQVLLSGRHVAYLVLHPRMPIAPQLVSYETAFRDPATLTILGNSITLTPGTITVEADAGRLVVHAIDDEAASSLADMEKKIAKVFGAAPPEASS